MGAEPPIVVGAALASCTFAVDANPLRRSPPGVRERLRVLSDRWRGGDAIELRGRPIPHAYRMLFRSLGIEPDERRIPVEAYVVDRLTHGAFRSRGLLEDALLIATVETHVGVFGADAEHGAPMGAFDAPGTVTAATRRLTLYAPLAPRVSELAVREALWTAWEIIDSG